MVVGFLPAVIKKCGFMVKKTGSSSRQSVAPKKKEAGGAEKNNKTRAVRQAAVTKKINAKQRQQRPAKTTGLSAPPEAVERVGKALQDVVFVDYIAKNVGSQANFVLKELAKGPRKDEQLAETVNTKLNEVRRVLNTLNKHGMVRYDVKRDNTGWLTFEWHIDYVAFSDFYTLVTKKPDAAAAGLPKDCNDFFVCGGCRDQGLLYSFDVAFDKSFRCECGKSLDAISRADAESLIKN